MKNLCRWDFSCQAPSGVEGQAVLERRWESVMLSRCSASFFVVRSTDILLRASPKHERDPVLKILHVKIFQGEPEEWPKEGGKKKSSSDFRVRCKGGKLGGKREKVQMGSCKQPSVRCGM